MRSSRVTPVSVINRLTGTMRPIRHHSRFRRHGLHGVLWLCAHTVTPGMIAVSPQLASAIAFRGLRPSASTPISGRDQPFSVVISCAETRVTGLTRRGSPLPRLRYSPLVLNQYQSTMDVLQLNAGSSVCELLYGRKRQRTSASIRG